MDHLDINSTTAVAGKAGFTLASTATSVVEFMTKWFDLHTLTVHVNWDIIETSV